MVVRRWRTRRAGCARAVRARHGWSKHDSCGQKRLREKTLFYCFLNDGQPASR